MVIKSRADLADWSEYRKQTLSSCNGLQPGQSIHVSHDDFEFTINGRSWWGRILLLGAKGDTSLVALKREGLMFKSGSGRLSADGTTVHVQGLGKGHAKEANKTLDRLSLSFTLSTEDAAEEAANFAPTAKLAQRAADSQAAKASGSAAPPSGGRQVEADAEAVEDGDGEGEVARRKKVLFARIKAALATHADLRTSVTPLLLAAERAEQAGTWDEVLAIHDELQDLVDATEPVDPGAARAAGAVAAQRKQRLFLRVKAAVASRPELRGDVAPLVQAAARAEQAQDWAGLLGFCDRLDDVLAEDPEPDNSEESANAVDLRDWGQYRAWLRPRLHRLAKDPAAAEPVFISRKKFDFEIAGKPWSAHLVLVGAKSLAMAQRLKREGHACFRAIGHLHAADSTILTQGLTGGARKAGGRTLQRLKLGYAFGMTENGATTRASGADLRGVDKQAAVPGKALEARAARVLRKGADLPERLPCRMAAAEALIARGDWAALMLLYQGTKTTTGDDKAAIREALLGSRMGWQVIAAMPDLGGAVLSACDPEILKQLDLDDLLGAKKDMVVGESLLALSRKGKAQPDAAIRDTKADPELFAHLATQIGPEAWNDANAGIGAKKRGLAARVCNGLWNNFNYALICAAVDAGANPSLPFNIGDNSLGGQEGVWSGFVQPLEHVLGKYLKEVGEKQAVDRENERRKATGEPPVAWTPDRNRESKIRGAEQILAHLEKTGTATVVTSWDDVVNSEMLTAFTANPGTIWGFEDVRMPFVQAAHDVAGGDRPLRMIELWEAIEKEALTPDGYARLLEDPKGAARQYVEGAIDRISKGGSKYVSLELAVAGAFYEAFRRAATTFLLEFASQLPKGTQADPALDAGGGKQKAPEGTKRPFLTVSDIAGIDPGKLMGAFACKAGIWWAKQQGEKIYYCLDGIDMDDVCNYKRVKNAAIDDFIVSSGSGKMGKPHMEVITLCELREIIKNWSSLKDTVVFLRRGTIVSGDELAASIAEWTEKMAKSNAIAGRTPAPPKQRFKVQLDALDPLLLQRLESAKEGDQDARDIVRKAGYLARVSGTQPQILLKFLMSKCQVLFNYDLLARELPKAAAALQAELLLDTIDTGAVMARARELTSAIGRCNGTFRTPLTEALVKRPIRARGANDNAATLV